MYQIWEKHIETSYCKNNIPDDLKKYFSKLKDVQFGTELLHQWQEYCSPTEETDADWEYINKPEPGYLVPIMIGYKAISQVHQNSDIKSVRDKENDVCFVESVHGIGEWRSMHHFKTVDEIEGCLWKYRYDSPWYLCRQESV